MRTLPILSADILDLIFHATDAGRDDPVLMITFAQWLQRMSDSEIAVYCDMLPDEPYTDADKEACRQVLEDFRETYLTSGDVGQEFRRR